MERGQRIIYEELCHAHQTGVKTDIETDPKNHQPLGNGTAAFDVLRYLKHLRVGIDGALVEQSALAKILMDKGIFTEQEYFDAIVAARRAEVARYEKILSDRLGAPVKLG
jgi:hypothetical protein